jgi:ABC-type transporter Mla subunit MlaD
MATQTEDRKNQTQKNWEDTANQAKDKAKSVVENVTDKAKSMAGDVADKAKSAAGYVQEKADQGTQYAGESLSSLGHTVRDRGPQSGYLGQANQAVASTLEQTGDYLHEKGVSGMAGDLTNMIKRNPIPSLLIGVGVGFLLARLTSSRS